MIPEAACAAMDGNFSSWGPCIASGIGGGSEELLILVIFGILIFILYKFNVPTEAAITIGVGMLFVMAIIFSQAILYALVVLVVIALAGYLVMAFLKHAGR